MFEKTYAPSPFVEVSRATRVETFVALTSTPGTTAPTGSRTTPRKVAAPGCCARAAAPAQKNTAAQTATARRAIFFLIEFCLPTDERMGKRDAVLVHNSDAVSWGEGWGRGSNYSLKKLTADSFIELKGPPSARSGALTT